MHPGFLKAKWVQLDSMIPHGANKNQYRSKVQCYMGYQRINCVYIFGTPCIFQRFSAPLFPLLSLIINYFLLFSAFKYLIPKRYLFSLLSFTACCLAVSYNINLSIAIVSMLNKDAEGITNETARLEPSINSSDLIFFGNISESLIFSNDSNGTEVRL